MKKEIWLGDSPEQKEEAQAFNERMAWMEEQIDWNEVIMAANGGIHQLNLAQTSMEEAYDFVDKTGITFDQIDTVFSGDVSLGKNELTVMAAIVWLSERRHRPEFTFEDAMKVPIAVLFENLKNILEDPPTVEMSPDMMP